MRISIGHRLFVCVLLAILGVVGCAVLLMRQNVVDSFADYAAGIELDRLDGLARSLARQHRRQGSWDFLPAAAAARESWVMDELQRLQQQHIAPPAPPAPPVPPVPPVAPVQSSAPPLPPLAPLPPMPPPPPQPPGRAADVLSLQERVSLLDSAGNYLAGRRAGPSDAGARLPVTVDGRAAGYLFIARPRNPNDALAVLFLQQLKESLLLIVLASVVLSALAAMLLAAHFRKPIRRLAEGARALAEGRYDTRLPFTRSDELGELAQRFNQLAHKLDQAETSRRQWVADTSHELRTPLSVLRAQLEAIQDGVRPANPDSVAAMLRQVLSLNKLIDELYVLARADVGTLAFQPERFDLWQLACQQAAAFEEKFRTAGLAFECSTAPGRAIVHGDPERLAQVLGNLFENCTRYSAAGGRICMQGAIDGGALILTIDDSAPGVPEAALPHLAERFYRVDASRSREHGGAGLGLALCQRIVSAHGGSMAFAHSPLGGLRVRLNLPLEAA